MKYLFLLLSLTWCLPAAADETAELQKAIDTLKAEVAALSKRVAELDKPQPPPKDNAHEGFGATAFESPWNHKDPAIIRYMPPSPFPQITKEIQYAIATDGNLDRPVTMHVTPVLVNARKPKELSSYRWLEDWRMERQPQAGGEKTRYNWVFNAGDVRQWRVFLPKTMQPDGSPRHNETYSIIFDFDSITRNRIGFIENIGQFGYLGIGSDQLKIHGSGKIEIGKPPVLTFYPAAASATKEAFLAFGADVITEKADKKYVRVKYKGKTYGIPLESLE